MIDIGWEEYHLDVKKLSEKIVPNKYLYLYGIPRGGLVPAVMLSHILEIPFISRVVFPDKSVLVVDDIAHSGSTLERYRVMDTATVYLRESCNIQPTFYGDIIQDDIWRVFPYEIASRELKCSEVDRLSK